jgi:TetR/AcrR family transcriptional regulator
VTTQKHARPVIFHEWMATMPHQTFFNLPDEKREQITQIAIDEFADNDFEAVSISRIVARAGIAKGSFYQYFSGKEDLYGYLLGLLMDAKMEFLSGDAPDPRHAGIFAYLRWGMRMSVQLQFAYPKLFRIGLRAMQTRTFPMAFEAKMRDEGLAFYRRLVDTGVAQGDIAPDVDRELAAVIFDSVLTNVGKYLVERYASEGNPLEIDGQALVIPQDVTELLTQALNILECGLGRRETIMAGGD